MLEKKLKWEKNTKNIEQCEKDKEKYIESTDTYIIFLAIYLESNLHLTAENNMLQRIGHV